MRLLSEWQHNLSADIPKSKYKYTGVVHEFLQVLYSQFVTLLEEGKVQTSRLESGTSRVYFDVKQPSAETVTASTTATSSAAAATPSSMEETRALSSGATATTTATATSSAVNHKFQRQFFIKV